MPTKIEAATASAIMPNLDIETAGKDESETIKFKFSDADDAGYIKALLLLSGATSDTIEKITKGEAIPIAELEDVVGHYLLDTTKERISAWYHEAHNIMSKFINNCKKQVTTMGDLTARWSGTRREWVPYILFDKKEKHEVDALVTKPLTAVKIENAAASYKGDEHFLEFLPDSRKAEDSVLSKLGRLKNQKLFSGWARDKESHGRREPKPYETTRIFPVKPGSGRTH